MNNMQFDEATQTHRGTLGRYRWNAEAPGQTFTGFNKPLQVTPDWLDQSRRDVFASFAGYWQNPWNNDGGWQTAMAKPWASRGQTETQAHMQSTQTTDGALHQLVQAMAGFAPAPAASTGGLRVESYAPMQMWGVDGGA